MHDMQWAAYKLYMLNMHATLASSCTDVSIGWLHNA
jgi:hypothetical protein